MSVLKNVNVKSTPQRERTLGRTDEVKNSAGGFVFAVNDAERLRRFLILGVEGGTFYASEKRHMEENVKFLTDLIAKDENLVLAEAVRVSDEGLAYSNSPAIFAVAAVMSFGKNKRAAREAVVKICRTATHMYEYAQYIDNLSGWGRAKRESVQDWFNSKGEGLAYQAVKYRNRNGWRLADLVNLSHPKGMDPALAKFIFEGEVTEGAPAIVRDFGRLQSAGTAEEAAGILAETNLPWEAMPTEFHKNIQVWKSIFYAGNLKGQALVRNITRLARMDAFKDMQFAADYARALTDEKMMEQTRLHPMNYLNAAVVYSDGQIDRNGYPAWSPARRKDWTTESVIRDALNDGYHASFKYVVPAGKRTMLALDVSGSMAANALGTDLSCAQVSAAMAMTIARTEPAHIIRGFTSGGWGSYRSAELTDLGISARMDLPAAMERVEGHTFGSTDCALPMVWAKQNKVEVDTFVVLTDSETWAGSVKPTQALQQYRKAMGIDAKLVVVGAASNGFTIADPQDWKRQMDIVGFSADTPKVIADFSAGRL